MAADNALYNTADVAETPTDAWTAKGTNAGKYQVGIKSGDFKNTSVNFTNVAFVIADGELEITRSPIRSPSPSWRSPTMSPMTPRSTPSRATRP